MANALIAAAKKTAAKNAKLYKNKTAKQILSKPKNPKKNGWAGTSKEQAAKIKQRNQTKTYKKPEYTTTPTGKKVANGSSNHKVTEGTKKVQAQEIKKVKNTAATLTKNVNTKKQTAEIIKRNQSRSSEKPKYIYADNGKKYKTRNDSHKSYSNMSKQSAKEAREEWGKHAVSRGILGAEAGLYNTSPMGLIKPAVAKKQYADTKSYKAGNAAGQMAGYLLGYKGAEDLTAKAAVKILSGKTGKKVLAKASGTKIAEKAAENTLKRAGQTATKQAVKAEAKKQTQNFGKSVAKDVIADLTVGTAIDTNTARANGVNNTKDYAKYMGMNAAANLVLGGAAEAAPVVKNLVKGKKVLPKASEAVSRASAIPAANTLKKASENVNPVKPTAAKPKEKQMQIDMTPKPATGTPKKAIKYQKKAERTFEQEVMGALDATHYKKGSGMSDRVKKAEQLIREGKLTDDEKDKLFDDMFSNALKKVKNEGNGTYDLKTARQIKNAIRTTPLTVSERTKANITDYNRFASSVKGKMRITKEPGHNIDTFYEEMRESYPGLLPEVNTQEEMLQELAKIYNDLGSSGDFEYIDPYSQYGDMNDYMDSAYKGFKMAVEKLENENNIVKKYTLSRKHVTPEEVSVQDAKNITSDIAGLKRQLEKYMDKVLLSEEDKVTVDRLVKGKLNIEDIKNDPNYAAIRNVYEKKKVIEDKQQVLKQIGAKTRKQYNALAESAISNSDRFVDKKNGLRYARETAERNMIDVAGKKNGEKLNATYITPIHDHEAASTTMKNAVRQEVKKYNIGTEAKYSIRDLNLEGIEGLDTKKKVSESALVQLYGEGKISKSQLRSIGANPEKISKTVASMRKIYDDLIDSANTELVRHGYDPIQYRKDYFPHFTDKKSDGVLGKIAKHLGFDINVDELPTDIAGLTHTFKPGKKWFGSALGREGDVTTYDALKGMDRYLEGVSDIIYHTEDIQKLRTLETAIRTKYADKSVKKRVQQIIDSSYDEATKQKLIDDILEAGNTHLSNMAVWLREYTDTLAGKKSISDRNIEHKLGRTFYNTSKALENRVAANMVAVNPASWLTNFIPLVQGSEVSNVSLVKGMADTVQNLWKDDGFNAASAFVTNRKGSDLLSRTKVEAIQDALSKPMEWIDQFTSQSVTRAMYYDCLKKGMSSDAALKKADRFAAGVIADRSKGALPTVFNSRNPLTKIFTMYQVEVNNQWSHLFKDIPRSKDNVAQVAYAFTKFAVGAYIFNDVYESFTGRRPAMDPLNWVNQFTGDVSGKKVPNFADSVINGKEITFDAKKAKASEALKNAGSNIANDLPFIGGVLGGGRVPIQSAIPDFTKLIPNAADWAAGDKNAKSAKAAVIKELEKPAAYLLPPVGGGQAKKTIEAGLAIKNGGVYGTNSKGEKQLKFAVDPSAANMIRGGLFGQYAIGNSKTYITDGFKQLSTPKTSAYDALVKTGMKNTAAEKFIRSLPSKETDAREYLMKSNLTPEQKNAVGKYIGTKKVDYSSKATYDVSQLDKDIAKRINNAAKTDEDKAKLVKAYEAQKNYDGYLEKAMAMVDNGVTTTKQSKAVNQKVYGSTLKKAQIMSDMGYDASGVVKLKKRIDKNEDGRFTKDELTSYLNASDLSQEQKRYIFAVLGAWNAKNPY